MANGQPMSFAGLWERWKAPDATTVESCTVITTNANRVIRDNHHRAPVIPSPEHFDQWLEPDAGDGAALLSPCPDDWLVAQPVNPRVNNARHDDPDCLKAVELPA